MKRLGLVTAGLVFCWAIAHTSAGSGPVGALLHVADGTLVKTADDTAVYLVDGGVLRHITADAFQRLYPDFSRVCTVVSIPRHLVQQPLGTGTRLVRAKDRAAVWLIDNGHTRRVVANIPAFNRWGFSWSRVQVVPAEEIDFLPVGSRHDRCRGPRAARAASSLAPPGTMPGQGTLARPSRQESRPLQSAAPGLEWSESLTTPVPVSGGRACRCSRWRWAPHVEYSSVVECHRLCGQPRRAALQDTSASGCASGTEVHAPERRNGHFRE